MSRFDNLRQRADETGDYGLLIGVALNARFSAEDGRYCECAEPVLHGFDLMCGECLLENRDQIAKREARIRAPHTFEPMTDLPYMCAVCAGWEDDQRHGEASDAES
jgi:hypothetical protein